MQIFFLFLMFTVSALAAPNKDIDLRPVAAKKPNALLEQNVAARFLFLPPQALPKEKREQAKFTLCTDPEGSVHRSNESGYANCNVGNTGHSLSRMNANKWGVGGR